MEPQGLARVLEDKLVGILRRPESMVEDAVMLVRRGKRLARRRHGIAAVIEAITTPRGAGDLDPFNRVWKRRPGLDIEDAVLEPVRPTPGHGVRGVPRIVRRGEFSKTHRAVGRPRVRIDQDLS